MKSITLIDGKPRNNLSVLNRNIQFGDGIFETCVFVGRRILFWQVHARRLEVGSENLDLVRVPEALWLKDIRKAISIIRLKSGVIKLILSRGNSEQGYAYRTGFVKISPVRIVRIFAMRKKLKKGIRLNQCQTTYVQNKMLAGIKHCNRLEQVLASAEIRRDDCVMLDNQSHIISTTRANLFIVKNNTLITPDISLCGIKGTRRQIVLELARALNIPTQVKKILKEELIGADEVFVTNSLVGIQSVSHFENIVYKKHNITQKLKRELANVSKRSGVIIKVSVRYLLMAKIFFIATCLLFLTWLKYYAV